MEAIIKVKASELNASLLDRIKNLLTGNEDEVITITLGSEAAYLSELLRSKYDLENGRNLVSFTMEELSAYTNEKRK